MFRRHLRYSPDAGRLVTLRELQLYVSAFFNPEKASFPMRDEELDALVRTISDQLPTLVEAPKNAALALQRRATRKAEAASKSGLAPAVV